MQTKREICGIKLHLGLPPCHHQICYGCPTTLSSSEDPRWKLGMVTARVLNTGWVDWKELPLKQNYSPQLKFASTFSTEIINSNSNKCNTPGWIWYSPRARWISPSVHIRNQWKMRSSSLPWYHLSLPRFLYNWCCCSEKWTRLPFPDYYKLKSWWCENGLVTIGKWCEPTKQFNNFRRHFGLRL